MFWAAQSTIEETFNAYTDASLTPRRDGSPAQTDSEKRTARFMSEPKVPTLGTLKEQTTKTSNQASVKKGSVAKK